ncbi:MULTISPECIES: hypothetical protein [Flavobacterium]|uniref:DUF4178 domain-containing protein n=1 Tax=Flavobacterium endoglycinae TaxID=2816357 RepID=A0ABX7QK31_9FLAO|nr:MULTISPECIES: hypothetical protein [Flavobacterium]QSW91476.1 hypothetical protein J0383_11880 [Flavobacterium endoglycinae]
MNQEGRIFQDDNFIFTEFNGLKLEKLVVCENPETKEPILIYLKVENHNWHQYFLDAGFGVWENWNIIDIDNDDDESFDYIDKTSDFDLSQKVISKIWCEPDQNNCKISIAFESNEILVLQTVHAEMFDSSSEILIIK